jgi:predicted O-linked N-acetylglucosamine transferase (SPINDLY family)
VSDGSPALPIDTAAIVRLLQAGDHAGAVAAARAQLACHADCAELWNLLAAASILGGDALAGWRAAQRALELDPQAYGAQQNLDAALETLRKPYREALAGLQQYDNEAVRLETAFEAVKTADDMGFLEEAAKGVCLGLFLRLLEIAEADRRWPFETIGRELAGQGDHRDLLYQIPRVRTDADRRELLDQHRAWARWAESQTDHRVAAPRPRPRGGRPRVGLVSADLRIHAVAPFVAPLVEHAAELEIDLYCYSGHPGPVDGFMGYVAQEAAALRHLPGASARDLAAAIAADAPDVLVEVGGSTGNNRLEVMAQRLSPRQVSWLGYPHSAGLSTIDGLVLDPLMAPTDPSLIVEAPLLMPRSWVAFSRGYFRDDLPLAAEPAVERNGHVTFGSAGSPYKYSAATLDAWGRILAATPGSRFRVIRPEGASARFRANLAARFARHGVAAERLEFIPVRGVHLPHYAGIDIALDTFPLTGGMTTCEALWMGAPVVSLAGKAVFERLSHSLLTNAGLADLSTPSVAAYVERAVALAQDIDARRRWLAQGRATIMDGVLGDTRGFADDFFRVVTGPLGAYGGARS